MPCKFDLRVALVLLCIFLNYFDGIGIFYSHPYLSKQLFVFNKADTKLLEINNYISLFARIAGGYLLGKIADKYGFIKTMKIICIAYFFVAVFLALFDKLDFVHGANLLCIVHGMLSFLRISSFIIPTVYIFLHCNASETYKYSALVWISVFLAMAAINFAVIVFTNMQPVSWCIVYAVNSIFSFTIYSYLAPVPCAIEEQQLKKEKTSKLVSKKSMFLAFLFAGIAGSGLVYQYFVIENYVKNVLVLETSQHVILSPFWITLVLILIPAATIAKIFGAKKTITLSLLGMLLSVGLLYIFPVSNHSMLYLHQILFAIFFGLFLSPSLALVYQLLKGSNLYFHMTFIFGLGFACFGIATTSIEKLNLLPPPFSGAFIIALLMFVCLTCMTIFRKSTL